MLRTFTSMKGKLDAENIKQVSAMTRPADRRVQSPRDAKPRVGLAPVASKRIK
jgi:hypothetical protein